MDLAVGAKQVFVLMSLFTGIGEPKLVRECTYPLTALRCVDRVYTDVATFEITGGLRSSSGRRGGSRSTSSARAWTSRSP